VGPLTLVLLTVNGGASPLPEPVAAGHEPLGIIDHMTVARSAVIVVPSAAACDRDISYRVGSQQVDP
jgi:hypothetical protein